ncbi:hypothetical protein B0J12DRAFT_19590 [Macrophomina phaseolina]|uniref:Uncharacterized protein n=1 Tax=Macrophomina phaseolina TaxID=35725 RepID=A0ABQ8GUL7_9PEZI|nr:hypothetical protein B0J12DRAFT_19590 [Macrophomina phaseolina]
MKAFHHTVLARLAPLPTLSPIVRSTNQHGPGRCSISMPCHIVFCQEQRCSMNFTYLWQSYVHFLSFFLLKKKKIIRTKHQLSMISHPHLSAWIREAMNTHVCSTSPHRCADHPGARTQLRISTQDCFVISMPNALVRPDSIAARSDKVAFPSFPHSQKDIPRLGRSCGEKKIIVERGARTSSGVVPAGLAPPRVPRLQTRLRMIGPARWAG